MPITRRGLGAGFALGFASDAAAQPASWPNRPVRLVSPFAPGGPQDVPGRFMVDWLTPRLGQPVIMEHKPGAGGALGMSYVANAPDGHTFLLTSSAIATLPAMRRSLEFDPFTDLVPVTLVSESPLAIAVRTDGPAGLAEYLAQARARPGRLSFGTSGTGSATHLAGALLMQRAGIELLHVPYRGTGLALNALLAGDIDSIIADLSIPLQHVRAGTLRAVGVTTQDRVPLLPEVPTLLEQVPDYVVPFWIALLGGRATAATAVGRLMAELAPLGAPEGELYRRMDATGSRLLLNGPQPLAARLRQEVPLWRQVAAAAGLQPE